MSRMDKRELIRAIMEAQQRMANSLGQLSNEQLLRQALDDWTGKDLVAHLAWWHDSSASVIAALRAGREPYDRTDPLNTTDAINERAYREHASDSADLTRRAFRESFARLLEALEPVTDHELFTDDRWPWLDGEALVEMILWDTSRHYDAHRDHFEMLRRES